MIDLCPKDLKTVKKILMQHVPSCEVRAFGSRINGKAKPYSDLDIVVISRDKLPISQYYRLKEVFEESDLSFRVDVLDWHRISQEFRKIIDKNFEVITRP